MVVTAVIVAKAPGEPFPNDLFTGACADTLAHGIYMTGWGKNSASQGVVFAAGAANYSWTSVAGNIPMAAGCGISYFGAAAQLVVAGNHLGGFFKDSAGGLPVATTVFSALEDTYQLRRYATDFVFTAGGLQLWVADCFLSVAPTPVGAAGVNLYTRPYAQSAFSFSQNFLGFAATGIASAVDAAGDTVIYATAIDFVGLSGAGPAYLVAINARTRSVSMIKSSGTASIQFRGVAIVPAALGTNGAKTTPDVTPYVPIPPFSPALLPSPSPSPSASVFAPLTNSVSGLSDAAKGGIAGGVVAAVCVLGCLLQSCCRRGAAYAMARSDDLKPAAAASSGGGDPQLNFFTGRANKAPDTEHAVSVNVDKGAAGGTAAAASPALPARKWQSKSEQVTTSAAAAAAAVPASARGGLGARPKTKSARRSSATSEGEGEGEGEGEEGRRRRGSRSEA